MYRKATIFTLILSLFATLVIGCSSNAGGGNVIKIATNTPLSGDNAILGEAIKLGAQLAIEDNKEKFEKLGFKLELVSFDDQADPKKGVANAQQIAADPNILGVVGHLNSGVSLAATPIYEKNKLVQVSPSNTAVDLSEKGWKAFHRICARDDFQGPAGAQFAKDTLKAKTVFIVQNKTAYGQGLAENFKKEAEKLGLQVLGYEAVNVTDKDFNGVLNQVKVKNPDVIYFGGMFTEGGLFTKQAREKGITVPILGGDGFDASDMVKIAGKGIVNTYYTSVAADISQTPEGKAWAERYKQKFNKDVQSYSFYAYDATNVLLKGLEDAIKKNGNKKPTREQVLEAVHAIKDFQGIATKVGFDDKGDNMFAKVFIFKFEGEKYPGAQVSVIEKK